VNQNVAFEIGAMFMLAVMFMAGTKIQGTFPQLGRNVQFVLITVVVIAMCVAAIRMFPEAYGELRSILPDSAPSARSAAPAVASPDSKPAAARVSAPKRPNPNAGKVSEVQYIVMEAPKSASPEAAGDKADVKTGMALPDLESTIPKENRGRHVLKSIGHALHIGKSTKKPE
jgi:hypothetical protein